MTNRINSISNNSSVQTNQDFVNESQKGKPIHEVFSKDELDNLEKLSRMQGQYWATAPNIQTQNVAPSLGVDSISAIPKLDVPEIRPYSNLNSQFFSRSPQNNLKMDPVSREEMGKAMALMSKHTAEQIMAIIIGAQSDLEKLGAIVSQNSVKKYGELQKIQHQSIMAIKEALDKDRNITEFLTSTQNTFIATAAVTSFVGLMMTAEIVTFGAATPFVGAFAAMGPYLLGGLSVLAAGETYTKVRGKENQVAFTELDHHSKMNEQRINAGHDKISNHAESDSDYKEHMIALFKHLEKMKSLILSK